MSEKPFAFGKNWQAYLAGHFSEHSLDRSVASLKRFLPEISGKSFLDVGCGSGVHSLSALRLGASTVHSFDVDEDSVQATRALKEKIAPESPWHIEHASMLDAPYLKRLGTFDVVYCWGVAHHTGDMWKALSNLPERVAPGGQLFIAIYNTVDGRFGSTWWRRVKRFYNHSAFPVRKLLEWGYGSYQFLLPLARLRNPFGVAREYEQKRGMSLWVDVVDWLGGYPYEYAKPEEMFAFFHERYGMELIKMQTTRHIGCNQFVFKKS